MNDDTAPPGLPPPPPPPSAVPPPPVAEGGAPDEVRQRAMQHATELTRTYPCAACGGDLEFNIAEQKLVCPHCGSQQEIIEDSGRVLAEQDFGQAVALLRSSADAKAAQQITGEKEIVCQNCGGHTTFGGSLTATRCPYCATPIQRDDIHDAPLRLPPDGVLPFKVADKAAESAIDKWIHSRWFAPSEFKKYHETGSFTSIYAAYFTYDADTLTQYTGQRGDTYTVTTGSGENQRTETRVRWSPAAGTVQDIFDDMTVLANDGFEDKFVQKLEPWPTDQAQPYSAEYMAGHLCRTYDRDLEQCFGEARQRMDQEIDQTVRRDIGGDQQRISSKHTTFSTLTYKHLLLPIWLLTVVFEGKPFQVFINGATGEVHGQRPYSKVKIAIAVAAVLIAIVVAIVLYNVLGTDSSTT